jgi:hypothetical protein
MDLSQMLVTSQLLFQCCYMDRSAYEIGLLTVHSLILLSSCARNILIMDPCASCGLNAVPLKHIQLALLGHTHVACFLRRQCMNFNV